MQVGDHVLWPRAGALETVDKSFHDILTPERIHSIVALIPGEWLMTDTEIKADDKRKVYEQFLLNRLSHSVNFVKEAQDARKALI